MPSLTAVIVTHANLSGLERMLRNLEAQTRRPDEVIVCYSGYPPNVRFDFEEFITLAVERDDLQDWGHDKRAYGLELAACEYVGFFNDDDAYSERYIEEMLAAAQREEADAVYCSWNEQPGCDFAIYHSTAGNFICRSELGRAAGYLERRYEADGDFIEAIKAAGARVTRVSELLYHHNV